MVTTTDRVEITTPDGHTRGSGKEPRFSRGHRGCGETTVRIATKVSPLGCRARQIEPEVPHCARHMTRAPARHHTPSPTHDTSTRPSPRTLPGLPPRHPSSPSPPRPGYRLPVGTRTVLVGGDDGGGPAVAASFSNQLVHRRKRVSTISTQPTPTPLAPCTAFAYPAPRPRAHSRPHRRSVSAPDTGSRQTVSHFRHPCAVVVPDDGPGKDHHAPRSRTRIGASQSQRLMVSDSDGHAHADRGNNRTIRTATRGCGETTARIHTRVSPLGRQAWQIAPEFPHSDLTRADNAALPRSTPPLTPDDLRPAARADKANGIRQWEGILHCGPRCVRIMRMIEAAINKGRLRPAARTSRWRLAHFRGR